MSILNLIILIFSGVFILLMLAVFVIAVIVGNEWDKLSNYKNKEKK
jgi:hypothetical protein